MKEPLIYAPLVGTHPDYLRVIKPDIRVLAFGDNYSMVSSKAVMKDSFRELSALGLGFTHFSIDAMSSTHFLAQLV